MLKLYQSILALIIGLIIFQGCDSNVEEEKVIDTNSTIELNVTTLIKGDEPLIGTSGLKRLLLINDESKFALLWSDYTNEPLPIIDFTNQVVLLYDMGGDRNYYSLITLTSVSAKKIDNSISTIQVMLTKKCPSQIDDIYLNTIDMNIRPYIFTSIQKSEEILMSEEIEFEICEEEL